MSLDTNVRPQGIAEIRSAEPVRFYHVTECPACGYSWAEAPPRMQYHGHACVPGADNDWYDTSQFGAAETPHLHVKCSHCSFTFTMQVASP